MDDAAPIMIGFTPINKRSHTSSTLNTVQPEPELPIDEPPKKRQKKETRDNLPPPPKTAKPRRKPVAKKGETTKTRRAPPTKATASKQSAASSTVNKSGVLSEKTQSKLNTFRYDGLPTPVSNAESCETAKENQSQVHKKEMREREMHLDAHEQSDSTLSSGLWRDQEPFSEYPWLQTLHPKVNDRANRVVSANQYQSEKSASPMQLLRPDMKIHTAQLDDNQIIDDELEKLLDSTIGADLDILETGKTRSTRGPLEIRGTYEESSDIWGEDDLSLHEDDLEILYDSTSFVGLNAKASDLANQEVSVQHTTPKHQQNDLPYNHIKSCSELPVKQSIDSHVPKEYSEFDEPDFEDMIDLLAALPGTPPWADADPTDSPETRSPDETLIHSPAASMHTVQGSPLKSSQLEQDINSRFVRPPHPAAVQTPSPIQGVCSDNRVLICFRIGEAINATIRAQREGYKMVVELYARVIHSIRAGPVQTFRIADLWSSPEKPGIVLDGRWVGWDKSKLWKQDGEVFWEEGLRRTVSHLDSEGVGNARKCRLLGSLERKAGGGYLVNILNLWEAAWDDIAFAKGLVFEPNELE